MNIEEAENYLRTSSIVEVLTLIPEISVHTAISYKSQRRKMSKAVVALVIERMKGKDNGEKDK
jgi:hypothetical protein